MEDHNTCIIVFGDHETQASAVAEALPNVTFFAGTFGELLVAAADHRE